MAEASDNT